MNGPLWKHKQVFLLLASIIVFTAIFVAARAPFYHYSSLASIQPDSTSYISMVHSIRTGEPLDLSYRTLGYPVFLWIATLLKNTWSFVVTSQIVISFLASIVFILSVYTINAFSSFPVAVCLAAFQLSGTKTTMDCAILADSLYSSALMLSFAFLMLAIRHRRGFFFLLAGIFCGMSIYFRPTGMILIPFLFLVAAYLYLNKVRIRELLFLTIAPVVMVLPVYFYNWADYGDFTFSSGSSMTLSITTGSFLEKNPAFPDAWNKAITKVNSIVDPADREIILNSWDIDKFYSSYHKYFACNAIWNPLATAASNRSEVFRINKTVSLYAIKRHRAAYAKIVLFNAYRQLFAYSNMDIDYLAHLQDIYKIIFIQRSYDRLNQRDDILKEYSGITSLSSYRVDKDTVTVAYSTSGRRYLAYLKAYRAYFMSVKWGYFLLFTIIVSFSLMLTRLRKDIYFVSLLVSLFTLLHIVGVSLFTVGELRMPQAVVFANYVSFVLLWVGMISDVWNTVPRKRPVNT